MLDLDVRFAGFFINKTELLIRLVHVTSPLIQHFKHKQTIIDVD